LISAEQGVNERKDIREIKIYAYKAGINQTVIDIILLTYNYADIRGQITILMSVQQNQLL
jgi:hypothetical protein